MTTLASFGVALAVTSALVVSASSARAEASPAGMAQAGRLTLTIDRIFGMRRDTESSGRISSTTFGFGSAWFSARVGADYAIAPRLTVGASFGASRDDYEAGDYVGKRTNVNLGPRVGYVLPFGAVLGLWPRMGVALERTWVGSSVSGDSTYTELGFRADAPLVIAPSDHFALTIGPSLDWAFHASAEPTPTDTLHRRIGVSCGVLGSF